MQVKYVWFLNFHLVNHPCVTMPAQMCLNGGTCTISGIDYVCKCAPGWDGRNCEIQGSKYLVICGDQEIFCAYLYL